MNLLIILGLLFLSLFLIIPLLEKRAPQLSSEQQQRLSRWILPLVGLSLVIALFKHFLS
ncbi:hypothetical protein IB286_04320 [Spongiibacter sp. KMU-158]|uniref:Uncharacterized protein n=1 Tax=Spongiibacter pelagi TaxID=2760804 RepID=A0A927BZ30_9GAMM|nr:hypothetical protein [Spongiibacter pelagi]MBD2858224.1 hypothetical protein [Spongiibacter pelagi]